MKRENNFGEIVKNARLKHNLSTRELAKLCSVSHTEISNIENGKRNRPSIFILKSFEIHLGLNFREMARLVGYRDRTISNGERYYELYLFNKTSRKD